MRTFLSLPREIRDLIYLSVLTSELAPPTSPREARGERGLSRIQGNSKQNEMGTYYPLCPFPSATSRLLLVCRQLHDEVRNTVDLLKVSMPLSYKIDCMLDHDFFVYPTWLSIPYLSSRIDTVDVDIRYFGATLTADPGHRLYDTMRTWMPWWLFGVLRRFLVCGPDFLAPETDSKLKTRVININIVPTSEGDDLEVGTMKALREGRDKIRNLPSLKSLASAINRSLWFSIGREAPQGDLIIECVDHFLVSVDGELIKSWDFTSPESIEHNSPPPYAER